MNKNRVYAAVAGAAIAAVSLGACHSGSSAPDSSQVAASAKATAAAADNQLKADGYTALHLPGFGKVDLGIKSGGSGLGYEVVYTAKNADLAKAAFDAYKKHPQQGVNVTLKPGNLVTVQANSVGALKTAATTLVKGGV